MTLRAIVFLFVLPCSVTLCVAAETGDEARSTSTADVSNVISFDIVVEDNHRPNRNTSGMADGGPRNANKLDDLFRSRESDFPFPPRLIRQSNYDIEIVDEPLLSDEFRNDNTSRKSNTARTNARDSGIVQTSGQAPADSECINILPLSGDAPISVLVDCAGEGVCLRRLDPDEQPIDVVLADCEAECPCAACSEKSQCRCAESSTERTADAACDAARTCHQGPSLAELLQAVLAPSVCETPVATPVRSREALPPRRFDGPFGFVNLPAEPVVAEAATETQAPAANIESCSQPEPPLKAKVEHLLEAARHLAGAGYEDEAKLFRVEAEAIQRASTRLLSEKRQELERLQREIAELELLTGQYDLIQLDFSILEFSVPADCDADGCSALHEPGFHILSGAPCANTVSVMHETDLGEFLTALERCACEKPAIIFQPKVVTTNGRTASISNGGSFVVPASTEVRGDAKAGATHDTRQYGIELQALPVVLGNDRIRLNLATEIAERDFSNAVNLNGTSVPGLTTRRCNTTVETRFGGVVAISCNAATISDGERKCMLVLVTPHRVSPLEVSSTAR